MSYYFPPGEYLHKLAREHPEYFDEPFVDAATIREKHRDWLMGGGPNRDDKTLNPPWEIACWSSEQAVKQAANNTKAFLRAHPEVTLFVFGSPEPMDWGCQCPKCLAMGRGYPAFMAFFEKAGRLVREKFPNHRFVTTPYGGEDPEVVPDREYPPSLIVNHPLLTFSSPASTAKWVKAFNKGNYTRYTYWGIVCPDSLYMCEDGQIIKTCLEGVKDGWGGATTQLRIWKPSDPVWSERLYCWHAATNWTLYLGAQALWDPKRLDEEGLQAVFDDYLTNYYGEAAEPARRFHAAVAKNVSYGLMPVQFELPANRTAMTEMHKACTAAVREMKRLARGDKVKVRVEEVALEHAVSLARTTIAMVRYDLNNTEEPVRKVADGWLPEVQKACEYAGTPEEFAKRMQASYFRGLDQVGLNSWLGVYWLQPIKDLHDLKKEIEKLAGTDLKGATE